MQCVTSATRHKNTRKPLALRPRVFHIERSVHRGSGEVSMPVAKKKNEDWVNSPRDALRGDGRSLDDDLEAQQLKVKSCRLPSVDGQ
jgi:hypothetical protein